MELPPAETPATRALAPIDVGDSLPSYILKNEQGEDVDVANLADESGVILFSIPKADTCESHWANATARALSVAQRVARHRRADSAISTLVSRNTTLSFTVSVTMNRRLRRNGDLRHATSASTIRYRLCETLTFFITTQKEFPYPLLSDPDRVLVAALGAKNPQGKTKRGHFIFAKGGKLVERKLPVSPGDRYAIVRSQNPLADAQSMHVPRLITSPTLALEFVKSLAAS